MAWAWLVVAGTLEVGWAFAMKQSAGFTRLTPTVVTLILMAGSIAFLSLAMKALPLGTAYAVWTGIGALGAFAVGIAILGEPANALRVASAAFILIGLVGLKIASPG
jgi:quaternary ammonium compound-resistance protein SugE